MAGDQRCRHRGAGTRGRYARGMDSLAGETDAAGGAPRLGIPQRRPARRSHRTDVLAYIPSPYARRGLAAAHEPLAARVARLHCRHAPGRRRLAAGSGPLPRRNRPAPAVCGPHSPARRGAAPTGGQPRAGKRLRGQLPDHAPVGRGSRSRHHGPGPPADFNPPLPDRGGGADTLPLAGRFALYQPYAQQSRPHGRRRATLLAQSR